MIDSLLEKNLLPDWLLRVGIRRLLAQRLRRDIEAVVGPEHQALAHELRRLRPWAKKNFATYDYRKVFFQQAVEDALG